jgi:3-oxoacyl-[acyl-carrier-protein] synthase-3
MKIYQQGVFISGTGSAVPEKIVTNYDLSLKSPTNSEWASEVLGIESRRHLQNSETLLDLCVSAANSALLDSNKSINDIDAIIIATSTPDYVNPSMASQLHGALNAKNETAAFDVQAVCSGFLHALGISIKILGNTSNSNVLILGADQFSKITDFTSRDSVFFGDGAGAAVISWSSDPDTFVAVELYADATDWQGFYTSRLSQTFEMTGKLVKEKAVKELPHAFKKLVQDLGFKVSEIESIFPHQPSKPVLDALESALELDAGILKRNLVHRANTAGATIPLLLNESLKLKEIRDGSLVGFAAIGSGWTWGVALTRWSKANERHD